MPKFEEVAGELESQKQSRVLHIREFWTNGNGKERSREFLDAVSAWGSEHLDYKDFELFHLLSGSSRGNVSSTKLPFDTPNQDILNFAIKLNNHLLFPSRTTQDQAA